MAYSGVTLVSFHFMAVSFRLVPVYSGTILVHSVSFRRHSASFWYIPVYSGIFRSVPVFSSALYIYDNICLFVDTCINVSDLLFKNSIKSRTI